MSANVKRRHLNASQLAMLGARIEPLYAEQAKANQRLSSGRGHKGSAPGRNLIHAAEQAAAAVNAGKLDVKAAASFATKPAEEQRELVRRVVHLDFGVADRMCALKTDARGLS